MERGNTRSYCMENSLLKRLYTCRKADCGMKDSLLSSGRQGRSRLGRMVRPPDTAESGGRQNGHPSKYFK